MSSPQMVRFQNDHRDLQRLVGESNIFSFTSQGSPPSVYDCRFEGTGLYMPPDAAEPVPLSEHRFRLELTSDYPRKPPIVYWQTPIYHPNFATNKVCTGNLNRYWVPGFKLVQIVEMLWDMVRYDNVAPLDPFNKDAAQWYNVQSRYAWPLDSRSIRDGIDEIIIMDIGNGSDSDADGIEFT